MLCGEFVCYRFGSPVCFGLIPRGGKAGREVQNGRPLLTLGSTLGLSTSKP